MYYESLNWGAQVCRSILQQIQSPVLSMAEKKSPNGVLLHHFNYLVLHFFGQLGELELKRKFSNFIGPYQWFHMQFQFIPAIPYQIDIQNLRRNTLNEKYIQQVFTLYKVSFARFKNEDLHILVDMCAAVFQVYYIAANQTPQSFTNYQVQTDQSSE